MPDLSLPVAGDPRDGSEGGSTEVEIAAATVELYNELKGSESAAGLATLQAILDGTYAPVEDAALEGTPTAPTAPPGTDTTQVANTAFVKGAVDNATYAEVGVPPFQVRRAGWFTLTPGVLSSFATTVGRLYLVPLWVGSEGLPVDRIGAAPSVAGTAGAVVRLGIYNADSNGMPSSLILDAGTIDATTTGTKYITIAATLTPGLKYLAAVSQVASCTLRGSSGSAQFLVGPTNFSSTEAEAAALAVLWGVTGALPAIVPVDSSNAVAPRITLRMA